MKVEFITIEWFREDGVKHRMVLNTQRDSNTGVWKNLVKLAEECGKSKDCIGFE